MKNRILSAAFALAFLALPGRLYAQVFSGSTASTVASGASPVFSLAAVSSQSPIVFEITPTVNVTTPTITNRTAGARFIIRVTTDGTHTWSWNGIITDNVCPIYTDAVATTNAHIYVDQNGSSLHGEGCDFTLPNTVVYGAAGSAASTNPSSGNTICNLVSATAIDCLDSSGNHWVMLKSPGASLTTPTLTSPSLGAGASPITETWTVGTGGVTANTLVQKDASNPAKIVAATSGAYGIAMSTVSAAGTVEVARYGTVSCVTDTGGSTENDKVIIGTGTVIDCKDASTSSSASIAITVGIIGTFRNTVSGGATALVELTPDHFGTLVTQINGVAVPANAFLATNGSSQPVAGPLQGAGSKVQLANGSTATSDYLVYDSGGSAIDSGVVCCTPGTAVPATSFTLSGPSQIIICTTTCTVTVPVPALNVQYCVMNDDNIATVITLSAIGSSARYENTARTAYGTAGTGTFKSGGAVGDAVCIVGRDATHYLTPSHTGTWTAN